MRDAERTRERILAAAVAEFGDKGFAGARVGEIAARAGVNVQLISYYFGGKAGLYREMTDRWRQISTRLSATGSLPEKVGRFSRESLRRRDWTRVMLWDGLSTPRMEASGAQPGEDGEPDYLHMAVADLRERQQAGELPAELDPAQLLLALFAAACAPVMLPQIAARMGLDPGSAQFERSYPRQVELLTKLLTRARPV